jgi:hypothetical protein
LSLGFPPLDFFPGRKVEFDPEKEVFVNDDEVNQLFKYTRRAPYTI